ncbi:MAG TPA: glycosyltransferase family 9 protein, partial [Candidatus Limnocylindrales bacterium]|nr:glycosyltransferase family 9 protein [Candidatus Limnocylindrales bacterium]
MPFPMTLVPDVRRIAVLRASALGDFVFALPALAALRAAYPAAEITLLARAWHAELLAGRPSAIDRVIALPEGFVGDEGGPVSPAERRRVLRRLRGEGFDLGIQLHGGGRNSNPIVAALGARVTAGSRTPDAPPLDRLVPYVYWQREIDRWLEVVALVGGAAVGLDPTLVATDDDRVRSERIVPPTDMPVVVLHPGATDRRRRWPAERFGAVAAALGAEGRKVLVTGSGDEADVVDRVVSASRGRAVGLTGRLDLAAL